MKSFSVVYDSLHCCGVTEIESTSQVELWFVNDHVIEKPCFLRERTNEDQQKWGRDWIFSKGLEGLDSIFWQELEDHHFSCTPNHTGDSMFQSKTYLLCTFRVMISPSLPDQKCCVFLTATCIEGLEMHVFLPYNPTPYQSRSEPGIWPLTFRRRGWTKFERKGRKIQGNSVVKVDTSLSATESETKEMCWIYGLRISIFITYNFFSKSKTLRGGNDQDHSLQLGPESNMV